MHIEPTAPPRALRERPLVLADVGRDAYEDEFVRLFALRDDITARLGDMGQILDTLDGDDVGGARV